MPIGYGDRVDTHPGERQSVLIPEDVNARFMAQVAARGGPQGSTLLYCWLRESVMAARRGGPLPPVVRSAPVRGRRWVKARWRQADAEYAAWRAEVEVAGSSVSAVLRARIDQYLASGGDAADPLRVA